MRAVKVCAAGCLVLLLGGLMPLGAVARTAVARPSIVPSSIVTGVAHSCALTSGGGVACWGANADGELGDGSFTDRSVPVNVVGLPSGVIALGAGGWHTCALTSAGALWCWGFNGLGQLGNATTVSSNVPVSVAGLSSGVAGVTAGQLHTCALVSGGAMCWGYNGDGELGDGTTGSHSTPVDVLTLASGVARLSAGAYHTCALDTTGAVSCWGANDFGDLGDGTTTNRTAPVAVVGLGAGAVDVTAGGAHTCVVNAANGVQCWGSNRDGELGDGSGLDRFAPVTVTGLASGVAQVSAGFAHTCARTNAGAALCWGDGEDGDLGNGATVGALAPVAVSTLSSGVGAISAGGWHTCAALATTNGARCWGANEYGQLGDGTTVNRSAPVAVKLTITPPTKTVVALGSGSFYEGDVGSHVVELPVTLRDPVSTAVVVSYSVFRDKTFDTATPGADFVKQLGTLTFAAGSTVAQLPVTLVGDANAEGKETLSVLLTKVTGPATLARKFARVAILDDDPQSGVRVAIGSVGVVEGNTVAAVGATNELRFHVNLAQPVPAGATNVVVGYTVVAGSAKGCTGTGSGCDFVSVPNVAYLTFTPGQSDQFVTVRTRVDTAPEGNETFTVKLVSITGAATIGHAQGTGTILNDD